MLSFFLLIQGVFNTRRNLLECYSSLREQYLYIVFVLAMQNFIMDIYTAF